jgi:hypothetical protein
VASYKEQGEGTGVNFGRVASYGSRKEHWVNFGRVANYGSRKEHRGSLRQGARYKEQGVAQVVSLRQVTRYKEKGVAQDQFRQVPAAGAGSSTVVNKIQGVSYRDQGLAQGKTSDRWPGTGGREKHRGQLQSGSQLQRAGCSTGVSLKQVASYKKEGVTQGYLETGSQLQVTGSSTKVSLRRQAS